MYLKWLAAISDLITTEVSSVSGVDFYSNQDVSLTSGEISTLPKVYLELEESINWESLSNGLDSATTVLTVRITNAKGSNSALLNLSDEIHLAIQNEKLRDTGESFSSSLMLSSSSSIIQFDHAQTLRLSYSTTIYRKISKKTYVSLTPDLKIDHAIKD
jgi:hypothetical protein